MAIQSAVFFRLGAPIGGEGRGEKDGGVDGTYDIGDLELGSGSRHCEECDVLIRGVSISSNFTI